MDQDAEAMLWFDFEEELENPVGNCSSSSGNNNCSRSTKNGNYRQIVCRHWLRGLCMKGDSCEFLHQFDQSRMPLCRSFEYHGECHDKDCILKHTKQHVKECFMYNLGFCPNGPNCQYKHRKLPGPPPPAKEAFQRIIEAGTSTVNKTCSTTCSSPQRPNHQEERPTGHPPHSANEPSESYASTDSAARPPLPEGNSRYFIVKSNNLGNLSLSVQRGMWATQQKNEEKFNEAFNSCDNVILIFSVNGTSHFQGCAKMICRIGEIVGGGTWNNAHGSAFYGQNFLVKWLKLCQLPFRKTQYLRNPYNANLPVKISRDGQELERSIGEQLTSLLFLEEDSELMVIARDVESKHKQRKIQAASSAYHSDLRSVIHFKDNIEDEDDNDEEESLNECPVGVGNLNNYPMTKGYKEMSPTWSGGDHGFPCYGQPRPIYFNTHFACPTPISKITLERFKQPCLTHEMGLNARSSQIFTHNGQEMMPIGLIPTPIHRNIMMQVERPTFMGQPYIPYFPTQGGSYGMIYINREGQMP